MNREIYVTDGEYFLYPIADEDRGVYTELHRQLNGDQTLFLNPRCKDMMWEQALSGKTKIFSIYNKENRYCGSIELQNPASVTPEIGIDLLECERNKGIAPKAVRMLAKTVFERQNMDYFLIKISSKNSHSKHVFEKMGAIAIGEEETEFKTIIRKFHKVMGDKDINDMREKLKKYFDEDEKSDEEVVYRYKLMPEQFI